MLKHADGTTIISTSRLATVFRLTKRADDDENNENLPINCVLFPSTMLFAWWSIACQVER